MGTFTNLGLSKSQSTFEVPVYEGFVEPTANGLMALTQESALELHQLNSALYVADVLHEQAAMESATEASALLEGVVKDSLTKARDFFVKLWGKIKAWFKEAFVRIKNLFLHGKKFVTENKKRLSEKHELGFKYKGRKITLDNLASVSEGKTSIVQKFADGALGQIDAREIGADKKFTKSLEEEKEELLKSLGHDEIGELTKEIRLSAFNGVEPEDADEIVDFAANDKDELIKIVSNGDKSVAALEKTQRAIDKELSEVIKTLNEFIKVTAKAEGDDVAKSLTVTSANRQINLVKYAITIQNAIAGAVIESTKAAVKSAESILRKYITYKPTKESFEYTPESSGESYLEKAMKLI